MNHSALLNWATEILAVSSPTPRLDAEVLLAHLLKIDRAKLYLQFEQKITEQEQSDFDQLIQRRLKGEPVSYIREFKEFWSLPFKVGPGVMIPRPDTEVLVESVVRGAGIVERKKPINILDVGTGSGNIAIALAKELPNAKITAIDISESALEYARENAKTNEVDRQINFIKQDFLTLHAPRSTKYDLIVSNPPYIPTGVIETLDAGIKNFEPKTALDGGADGLDFYRKLGESLPHLLKPEGVVAVEIGEDQAEAVKGIFAKSGLKEIEVIKDYAGLSRVVIARSQP